MIVWFTTEGMCAKNKNIRMWREQAIIEWSRWSDLGEWPLTMLVNLVNSWLCLRTVTTRVISSGDLYCCLLPRCEALRTCLSGFPIASLSCQFSLRYLFNTQPILGNVWNFLHWNYDRQRKTAEWLQNISIWCISVRECIFLRMQKIFAQIWSRFSQTTYKQQALMLRLKCTIVNKSRFLHA